MKRITSILIFIFIYTPLAHASHEEEVLTIEKSFNEINHALFTIEETLKYCNQNFSEQKNRNDEAYDKWELQYSFFLREFDKNYETWKKGFSESQQIQIPILEQLQHAAIYENLSEEYKKGGVDKCYAFKPALFRPRNNIELSKQESVNYIRSESRSSFSQSRQENGSSHICAWQQDKALEIFSIKADGKDLKSQKLALKEFKSSKTDTDKKLKSLQVSTYGEMIGEIYKEEALSAQQYAAYRYAQCERDIRDLKSLSLKKSKTAILACEQNGKDQIDRFAICIHQALVK